MSERASSSGVTNIVAAGEINVHGDFNVGVDRDELRSLRAKIDELHSLTAGAIASKDELEMLSRELHVTANAVGNFFRILGQNAVPYDQLPERLAEIATTHRQLLARVSALDTEVPPVRELAVAAAAAIERGDYDQAEQIYGRPKISKASD